MALIIIFTLLTVFTFIGLGFIPYVKKVKFNQNGFYDSTSGAFVPDAEANNNQKMNWKRIQGGVEYTQDSKGYHFRPLQFVSLFLLLFILFGVFRQVDATEVVVVTRFGEVQEVIGTSGLKVKSPLEAFHKYSLKIQEIRYDNIEDAGISFYSRDSQPVEASLTIQWRIKKDEAQTIYENFGGDVENVRARLGSLVVERTKSSLSLSTAEDLISSRSALSASIEALIVAEIEARNMPVTVVAVYLTDFAFSQAFEDAVEAKMIADQQRLKAETEKQIAIIQAEQQLATTILQAQSALEQARGEANAIIAIAQAEAAALSAKVVDVARTLGMPVTSTTDPVTEVTTYIIDTSGSTVEELKVIFDYIQYIEYLATWDGKLPQVITDGSGIIINP